MSSSNLYQNKKLPQRIDKYTKSDSTNNMNKFSGSSSNNVNLDQLSKAKPRPDSFNLRQKEEGFSVYLMGANEERIKNMRKKELVEKSQKSHPKNNSKSIANRKKWDLSDNKSNNSNNIFNNFEINNNNNNNLNSNEIYAANASRSKSRKKQEIKKPIAAHIDYKAISKLILNNNTTATSNINFNHRSNHNYELNSQNNNLNLANSNYNNINSSTKHINSKDSIANLEEMLNDIHTVNRNITNLNKFNLNSESPINKRRRNWGEPKYNIVFPDLSTSIEQNFGGAGVVSSKIKKRNTTNYSNNVISNNNLNSSFNKISENEIDGYNSVIGGEYNNLNSSIAGVSKEREGYLGRAKLSSASNNNDNKNFENNSVNYVSSTNNLNNKSAKNQCLITLTYEQNSGNSIRYNNSNKNPNLINNSNNKNDIDYSNNSNHLQLNLNKNPNQSNNNLNNNNNNNITINNLNNYTNIKNNNKENSSSTTNFKNSGSSLILSNLNHSVNNALNYNKNTYSSNSNQNVNSNPDIIVTNTNNNFKLNIKQQKRNSKNIDLQNLKSLNSLSNLNSNKQITNEFLYENGTSAAMANRYWEAGGASDARKNYNLNSSNEHGKNDEVMLVLENLNNSEILNISNSGFNNNNNINANFLEQHNSLTSSTQNYNYLNAKVNSETGVIHNKTSYAPNNKKYSNIAVNLNNTNTSSLNTRKFISLNSHSHKEKDRKLEELNNSSNNKHKIILGGNLNIKNRKLNIISNNNNNPNLVNLSAFNNNMNNSNIYNNTTERPFSSIVNLSKLKAEKLKISDLAGVPGISPKNDFPSIQFIYKSPQNINLKSGQRPLSHIQKSKSILNSKTSTNYINSNIFSNNNSNANVIDQILGNQFEISSNLYNFKNANTYSTMDRFSSREKQTNFLNNNNNNFPNKTNNKRNNVNNLLQDDNLNLLLTKEISNTQFNFSRKKNQYPTISNVQKLNGNILNSNNYNNISNNTNINNFNNVLSNLIYSRNPTANTKNKSSTGNNSNIIESNVVLSSSNYKDANNYNSKKSESNSSINNFEFIMNKKTNNSKKESANNKVTNSSSVNKFNQNNEKKTDLLQHLEKLDDKKIKKVFKYIEKLSENNYDTSELSVLESRNFAENLGKNMEKLNINYIKTDSINFGNININVNNNHNSNVNNNMNIINTTAIAIDQLNSFASKASGTPNIRKESATNHANLVKTKLLNLNNSINAGSANAVSVANTTQGPKLSFSSSMKERNKKHQTLEDEEIYASKDKEEIGTYNNINNEEKKSSSIKNYSAISLLVHSNWGNAGKCGFTEVQLLDEKNRKIEIKECHVFNGSEDSINKITNNKFNTTDENDMWVSNFAGNLRIEIYFEPNTKVDKIIVWNFNGKDLSKGIREVDIIRRNKIVWKGIIQKGTNALKTDFSTKIKIEKENSITNFDFINLIYRESLENFDFLSSTINSPSKSLLKSKTGITNNINSNSANNNNNFNLNLQKKANSNLNVNTKLNCNQKLNLNKTEYSSKNIFVENNLSYNNSNNNNEIVIAEDFLRNSVSSVGNTKINFDSLNASSSARNNPFNKLIASVGINKTNSSNTNKNQSVLSSSQSLKNKNSQASKNINFVNTNSSVTNLNNNPNVINASNPNVSNFNSEFNSNVNYNNNNNSDNLNLNNTNNLNNLSSSSNFNNAINENPNLNLVKSQSSQPQQSCQNVNLFMQNNENESEINTKQNLRTSLNTKGNLNSDSPFTTNQNLILVSRANSNISNNLNDNNNKNKNQNLNSSSSTNNINNINNDINNKLNIYNLSSNNNSLIEPRKSECLTCKRIKIVLRAGYGDPEYIGLTGIQFFDENEEPVNIEKAKTIGALPKDINTYMNNCGDPRIFENVFNLINETNDDNYMWLTVYNAAAPPYIEISYEDFISISSIKFWNYNKNGDLHRGVKIVDLILDEDYKNQISIVLRKGLGEDNVDYSQTVTFPYKLNLLTEEEIEPFQNIKPASLIYNQDFETPYLPTGFNLKLSLISNWGDPKYIGFSRINLYDQCGNEILSKNTPKIIQLPIKSDLQTHHDIKENDYFDPLNLISHCNSSIENNNLNKDYLLSNSNNDNKTSNLISSLIKTSSNSHKTNSNLNGKYWITEFNDISKYEMSNNNLSNLNLLNNFETLNIVKGNSNDNPNNIDSNNNNNSNLNTFSNFYNNENANNYDNQNLNNSEYYNNHVNNNFNNSNVELNTLYFIFDKPISIGFIEILNIQDKPERGVKEIQISLDENIIYKGNLKKFNDNSDKTTILFSSDNKITKLINLKTLHKANLKNGYVYKQNTKPAALKGQSDSASNFNSTNKMQTLNGNAEGNRNNFSPTFNMGNNNANLDNNKDVYVKNEQSQQIETIVHQLILECEASKQESERVETSDK